MKTILLAALLAITNSSMAQGDSLASAVYSWNNAKAQKTPAGESRNVLKGSTLDLASIGVHTSTLGPGRTNHPPVAYSDKEELIVIKEGEVKVTINDSNRIVGAGSVVFISAGDQQSFQNVSTATATYYVFTFKTKTPVNEARTKKSGGSVIKEWKDLAVTKTDKGESRPIFDKPTAMFERFDIHATALNPGFASHLPHTHCAEEIILMLKGNGEMQIGSTFHKAEKGDVIFLEANILHGFKNTGNEQCGYLAIQWHNP